MVPATPSSVVPQSEEEDTSTIYTAMSLDCQVSFLTHPCSMPLGTVGKKVGQEFVLVNSFI